MTDRELIQALRKYAKGYTQNNNGLNPGVAIMIANRMEELVVFLNDNMKIKFGLGDRVWFPDIYDDGYYVNKDGYIIDGVSVTNSRFGTSITYTLQGEYGQYGQNKLYGSYKEAKESVERRNC